jgi:hypothetical protein
VPPNIRLIDPATNAVSDETFVDVWRMVPSVNNVALTGPDDGSSIWPRDPNAAGGDQLDARLGTLQEQRHSASARGRSVLRRHPDSRSPRVRPGWPGTRGPTR